MGEQLPGAQDPRRNAAADVAHHDRLSEVETENMARVDPGIDASDDPQRLVARERQAGERAAGGEPSGRRTSSSALTAIATVYGRREPADHR